MRALSLIFRWHAIRQPLQQIHANIFSHVITTLSLSHLVRDLRNNQLSGTIPNNMELSALKNLYVHHHAMNGQRIRRDMPGLTRSTILSLHNKSTVLITCPLICSFFARILRNNSLSGTIPNSLGKTENLRILYVRLSR